ncbi:MAG: hypothetical protein JW913_13405 [Chitinispirillaceae bacterium]|nr:hypothetical protein [Chitinispirillaceae bacterium]
MKNLFFAFCLTGVLYAQWQPLDSLSSICRVPAKSRVHFVIDRNSGIITAIPSPSTQALTAKALQAIARSPRWLAVALEDRFAGMSAARQDSYAATILDARDPYVDEVAFTIAHLSVEVLNNKSFYADIITENAQGVYCADSVLEYVEIIDSGSAATGGDYYSTTRYRVKKDGATEAYTLPRDIYYWFVVHPKLQGELPAYISPDDPNPTAPPAGKFWRTFFWSHRENGCGSIEDTMKGITFLWANKINSPAENGALGRLSLWCNRVLPWGGGTPQYRWPQPVYIYSQHCGTCSEHSWFANAAARTALIPVTLTKAPRFDHKWNEFFCGRWIDWEPINGWIDRIDEPSHANDYWSDPAKSPLNGCFNWRGDGYIWGTTERYSPVCTLSVSVADSRGAPVDGARITIDADGVPGNFLMTGWTGSDGRCCFLLGDEVPSFTAAVKSALGDVARTTVISNSLPGKRYDWSPKVAGTVSATEVRRQIIPHDSAAGGEYRIVYTVDARREFVYGKHEYSLFGYSFPCTFSDERGTGALDLRICDSVNFSAFTAGKPFDAAVIMKSAVSADSFLTLPQGNGPWYLVLSGETKTTVTSVAEVTVRLLRRNMAGGALRRRENDGRTPSFSLHAAGALLSIDYALPEKERLMVRLHTARGGLVAVLCDGKAGRTDGTLRFDLHGMTPGVYCCRVSAAGVSRSSLVCIVK